MDQNFASNNCFPFPLMSRETKWHGVAGSVALIFQKQEGKEQIIRKLFFFLHPISGQLKSAYTMSSLPPVTIVCKLPPSLPTYLFNFSSLLLMSWHNTAHKWDGLIWEGVVVWLSMLKSTVVLMSLGLGVMRLRLWLRIKGRANKVGTPMGICCRLRNQDKETEAFYKQLAEVHRITE